MIEEHLQEILNTPPLALDEILSARERRADTQRQLLEEGQGTLICLTLNIAGAVKSAPLFTKAFEEGKSRILTQLRFERAKIGKCIERHERTGESCTCWSTSTLSPLKDGWWRSRRALPSGGFWIST